jgi:hypothetical protein
MTTRYTNYTIYVVMYEVYGWPIIMSVGPDT